MSDVQQAVKPARNMKPMAKAEPVMQPLPQSAVPAQTLREASARKLKPHMFQESGQTRLTFEATLPAEWDYSDTLDPAFWSYIASKIGGDRRVIGSFIHLDTEDQAFYALLKVADVRKDGLAVVCIGPSVDPQTGEAMPVDLKTRRPWTGRKFDVRWNKASRGYDVIRKADEAVVADGGQFPTVELAVAWAVAAAKKAA